MKKLLAVVMAMLLIFSFAACSGKDNGNTDADNNLETYTVQGFSIQMEKGLTQSSETGFDAFFSNDNFALAALKETAEEFNSFGYDINALTEEDYAQMVADVNGFEGFVKNADGKFVYTYVENVEGEDYFYYTTIRKGSDCFWVVNFFCLNDQAKEYEPQFEGWAKTIEIQ